MPVKVGCASDYNKNHPKRKTRDKETVVLVANRRYEWVDCDEHITELAPRIPTVVDIIQKPYGYVHVMLQLW